MSNSANPRGSKIPTSLVADSSPAQALLLPLAITLAVIGSNLLGDGLRDVLDPRLKR